MLIFFHHVFKKPHADTYALSFYYSKMNFDRPNRFGRVQSILVRVKLDFSWLIFISNLDLSKMIWTRPKKIGPVHNDWYSTKKIWTVQNQFGPIHRRTRHKSDYLQIIDDFFFLSINFIFRFCFLILFSVSIIDYV